MDLSATLQLIDREVLHEIYDVLSIEIEIGEPVWFFDAWTDLGQKFVASDATAGSQSNLIMNFLSNFRPQKYSAVHIIHPILSKEVSCINRSLVKTLALQFLVVSSQNILELLRQLSVSRIISLHKNQIFAEFLGDKYRHSTFNAIISGWVTGRHDHMIIKHHNGLLLKVGVVHNFSSCKEHVHVNVDPGSIKRSFFLCLLY